MLQSDRPEPLLHADDIDSRITMDMETSGFSLEAPPVLDNHGSRPGTNSGLSDVPAPDPGSLEDDLIGGNALPFVNT